MGGADEGELERARGAWDGHQHSNGAQHSTSAKLGPAQGRVSLAPVRGANGTCNSGGSGALFEQLCPPRTSRPVPSTRGGPRRAVPRCWAGGSATRWRRMTTACRGGSGAVWPGGGGVVCAWAVWSRGYWAAGAWVPAALVDDTLLRVDVPAPAAAHARFVHPVDKILHSACPGMCYYGD